MGLAAVIFDLDGVLVDSEGVWNAARREIALQHGGRWPSDAQSSNGIRSAAAAGMTVIAVPNREFAPAADALALAHDVLESLAQLTPDRLQRPSVS